MHQFFIDNKDGFPPSTIFYYFTRLLRTEHVMSEDQPSHAVVNRVKHIAHCACVSGKFGDFIASTDGKCQKWTRIYGHVIET
jgi:hypothetical protein